MSNSKSTEFPTSMLWQIAAQKSGQTRHVFGDVVDLAQRMFPGIIWHPAHAAQLTRYVISPELKNLFNGLADCESEPAAIKQFGATVSVPVVRPIDRYEWLNALEAQ